MEAPCNVAASASSPSQNLAVHEAPLSSSGLSVPYTKKPTGVAPIASAGPGGAEPADPLEDGLDAEGPGLGSGASGCSANFAAFRRAPRPTAELEALRRCGAAGLLPLLLLGCARKTACDGALALSGDMATDDDGERLLGTSASGAKRGSERRRRSSAAIFGSASPLLPWTCNMPALEGSFKSTRGSMRMMVAAPSRAARTIRWGSPVVSCVPITSSASHCSAAFSADLLR
mmetsp:Transcript_86713/g.242716  ORF Transcript_86713/g.242716 Transcript_86713/m.242716 type:complete len:231 (-) Transcript_86713:981-1673(-)